MIVVFNVVARLYRFKGLKNCMTLIEILINKIISPQCGKIRAVIAGDFLYCVDIAERLRRYRDDVALAQIMCKLYALGLVFHDTYIAYQFRQCHFSDT